jgi:hypothetical protein
MTGQRSARTVKKAMRLVPLLLAAALAVPAGAAAADMPARTAASKIVVRAKFKGYSPATMTITYTSTKGTYSATRIGIRRYRLRGTINGRRLRGRIRTRQAAGRNRYVARGTGRLGRRKVRISGGGPNTLRTATLILR